MIHGTYSIRLTPVPFEEMQHYIPPEEQEAVRRDPPAPPPVHRITFGEAGGLPYGIYETEHGKQVVGNLCYTGDVIRFTALAGTPGDEFFLYAVTIRDGTLTGEAYQPGKPHSPLRGEKLSD